MSVPTVRRRSAGQRRSARATAGVALWLTFGLALPGTAFAQEMTAARKAGRGLAGITLGVLEIPGNIVQEARTNGGLSAATIGLGVGIGKFVTRELVGVYELLSAPFEEPPGFEPILVPEFPWQYFESEPGRAYGFGDSYLREEEAAFQKLSGAVVTRRRGALTVRFPSGLLFSLGSAELGPVARGRLKDVAATLKRYPDTHVQILGYTDSSGSDAFNLDLSKARALAVRGYLVSQGVAAGRVESAGFGKAGAIASNSTPDGRRHNRRVDILVRASSVAAFR
ncbi:MAG: OmpA family protein [Myxococcota bacterium]